MWLISSAKLRFYHILVPECIFTDAFASTRQDADRLYTESDATYRSQTHLPCLYSETHHIQKA